MVKYNFNGINGKFGEAYVCGAVEGRALCDVYHSHDFYEWVIALDGSVTQLTDGAALNLKKGEGVILPSSSGHSFTKHSSDCLLFLLSVEASEQERFFDAFEISPPEAAAVFHIKCEDLQAILRVCQGDRYQKRLLLSYLIKCYTESLEKKADIPERLKEAVELMAIAVNLKEGVTALIRLSGYSQSQLSRLMKKHYGTGLSDYVKELRLTTSYERIVHTREHIEEISAMVGYESFSHFNKIFKSRFGITPAALRQERIIRTRSKA